MNAVILAAGRGSRMARLTDKQPKCLIKLGGKTLLDWQLDAIKSGDIDDIFVVRGYKKESLSDQRFKTFDNPRWNETNMVMSLVHATSVLRQSDCVVSYSDIVYHPDIIHALTKAEGEINITYDTLWYELWAARFVAPLNDAETFRVEDGCLTKIGEKTEIMEDIQGQYMGLLKLTPKGWNVIENFLATLTKQQLDNLDVTAMLRLLVNADVSIHCVPIDARWCEVDSESDIKLYEELIQQTDGKKFNWLHDWRW